MPQTDASLESELLPKSWVLAEILGFDGRTGNPGTPPDCPSRHLQWEWSSQCLLTTALEGSHLSSCVFFRVKCSRDFFT